MQRSKGAAGEREVVHLLREAFPNACRRASGEESQEDRGRDLKNTGRFVVQVQLARTPTPEKKWAEAEGVRTAAETAVAFTRRSAKRKKGGGVSSGPWLATLLGEQLVALIVQRENLYQSVLDVGNEAAILKEEVERLKKLDVGALETERDQIRAERNALARLLEKSKCYDGWVEAAQGNALDILRLEAEVAALRKHNAELTAELGKEVFGG